MSDVGLARSSQRSTVWPVSTGVALGAYFLAFLIYAAVAQRGLVADGAGYLVSILSTHHVSSAHPYRWTANALTQWPVVLALWAGVRDLWTLSVLYSAGLLYLSVVSLAMSWLLLPEKHKSLFALPLLGLIFGWMASCYAAISQSEVIALWFWPTAFALAFGRLEVRGQAIAILLLVAPLLLMHEAMSLLGPLLIALIGVRLKREPAAARRSAWIAIGLWLAAGSLIGLYYSLFPYFPAHRQSFLAGLFRLKFLHEGWTRINLPVVVALLSGGLMLACCWAETAMRRFQAAWLPAFGISLLVAGFAPLLFPSHFAPLLQSEARSWAVAVPVLLVLGFAVHYLGFLPIPSSARSLLFAIGAFAAAAQITWQTAATIRWDEFLDGFDHRLVASQGLVAYETAFAPGVLGSTPATEIAASAWTFPAMSIVLAPGGHVRAIISNPRGAWQPFDPANPASLPSVPGIDYQDYIAHLR
jgi:hypothetical protein